MSQNTHSTQFAIKKIESKRVQAYPPFTNQSELIDFITRAAWHFSHSPEILLLVPLASGLELPKQIKIPKDFDPSTQATLDNYLSRIKFQQNQTKENSKKLLDLAEIILKTNESEKIPDEDKYKAKKKIYRVDPKKVRQEGSFYIQCAFDLHSTLNEAILDCKNKFTKLISKIGEKKNAWVMATGPSVEKYKAYDYKDSAVIVCNSVILNEELIEHCKPSILVFADPIFHFGVSQYAGKFRESVKHRLEKSDITIIVPIKYYPLLISIFPKHKNRIIGIPFKSTKDFNLNLLDNYYVKTTANILTLLLLPIATSISKTVHLIGCDGRPFTSNDYFWSHGKTVQISEKMANIKLVHPGFFDIDYNEYYYEHCHNLENFILQAEKAKYQLAHHGKSYIPALQQRQLENRKANTLLEMNANGKFNLTERKKCIVLEPDGIGMNGHYVRWHRNLTNELRKSFDEIDICCNKKQDPTYYNYPAHKTFTAFSWNVSRSEFSFQRNFMENATFQRFKSELLEGILQLYPSSLPKTISIYMYYGSIQILKALQLIKEELQQKNCEVKSFICLFHESVILDPKRSLPRFPPNAKSILMESAAQVDSYKIASVTSQISDFIFDKFDVKTEVFPNPIPDLSDDQSRELLDHKKYSENVDCIVLFPGNPRDEKGGKIIEELLQYFIQSGVPTGYKFVFRGTPPTTLPHSDGIEFLGEEITDDEYWLNLSKADIVVIPYVAPGFAYRTSGIMVDTLLAGTPAIVIKDTWLAHVVKEYRIGLAIDYKSPISIISAVKVLRANQAMLRRHTTSGAKEYLKLNNWKQTAAFAMKISTENNLK